jgi:hypothetical protein
VKGDGSVVVVRREGEKGGEEIMRRRTGVEVWRSVVDDG